MKILTLILILILIYFFKSKSSISHWEYIFPEFPIKNNDSIIHWKDSLPKFPMEDFKNKCGNILLNIGDFTNNGIPDLYPNKIEKQKLSSWFDNIILGNKQSRLIFKNNSKNQIALFIIDWFNKIKNQLPSYLQQKIISNPVTEYTLRISKGKWEFPSHFDGIDQSMLVLSGDRNVIFNNTAQVLLHKSDIIFFKGGVYHKFWCSNQNNTINMTLNLAFKPEDNAANLKFEKNYPKQINRIRSFTDHI